MFEDMTYFLAHWAMLVLALWLASKLFSGLRFETRGALLISALLLGFVNAFVKPLVILLTLPFTLITLGFFLLVINALMIKLVASMVSGFKLSGFWTAFFASIFISLFSFAVGYFLSADQVAFHSVSDNSLWI